MVQLKRAMVLFCCVVSILGGNLLAEDPPETISEFKKGVEAYNQKNFDGAVEALIKVPELGGYLSYYKHWFLGLSYYEQQRYKDAEPEFLKLLHGNPSVDLRDQSRFYLGEMALRQKRYKHTLQHLRPLLRQWRSSHRLPEVLYPMMVSELKLGRTNHACRYARKLYSHFPAHPVVSHWPSDLTKVKVDDLKLPCKPAKDDFKTRVRRLQWAGESPRAHQEILGLMKSAPPEVKVQLEMILAGFFINEGAVDDALNLLTRYYPKFKGDMSFLMLLGHAAARSGEYQTAVGAYERAFSISPRSRKGREALYYAAHLSYQFQDYDGAVRKFNRFAKINPRSGLSRDASWHLAWLQYLRRDYSGAIKKFELAGRPSGKGRRRRAVSPSFADKLNYWTGVAQLRLNKPYEARAAFEIVTKRNPVSYYSLLAKSRLRVLTKKIKQEELERIPASLRAPDSTLTTVENGTEEDENEDQLAESEADGSSEEESEGESESDAKDEVIVASDFSDPKLRARIEVARKLVALGLQDLAKWELWEIERRTRNKQYLRDLIQSYEAIGSHHRSAAIADIQFSSQMEATPPSTSGSLWLSGFPQAYPEAVRDGVNPFGVEPNWVWSIMRAESFYRVDVISPVGARGLMQLMPHTARNLNRLLGDSASVDELDLANPETNIRLGAQYLGRLRTVFKGHLALASAAYNAGPHRVETWLVSFGHLEADEFVEHIPFLETRNYVKKVVRNYALYQAIYDGDTKAIEFMTKPLGVPIPSRASTRENWDSI